MAISFLQFGHITQKTCSCWKIAVLLLLQALQNLAAQFETCVPLQKERHSILIDLQRVSYHLLDRCRCLPCVLDALFVGLRNPHSTREFVNYGLWIALPYDAEFMIQERVFH